MKNTLGLLRLQGSLLGKISAVIVEGARLQLRMVDRPFSEILNTAICLGMEFEIQP